MPRLSPARKELLTTMMKEAIFEAAIQVLGEHGVGGMTMDRLAAAAKLAKGSLYHYFPSKDDLLRFVHHRLVEPLSQTVETITTSELSAPDKLRAILVEIAQQVGQHRTVIALLLREESVRELAESSRQSARQHALEHLTRIFAQGVGEGVFRRLDAMQSARIFLACLNELFELQVAAGQEQQIDEAIETMMSVFLHGVSVPQGAEIATG